MVTRKLLVILTGLLGSALAGLFNMILAPSTHTGTDIRRPTSASVIINEVGWSGTAASYADEWIELHNNTASPVPLSGWHVRTADGLDLALSGSIPAHGYYLIERTDDNTISDIHANWTGPFGGNGLTDAGETLTLTNASEQVIDTANADGGAWPAGNNNPDHSMERIDSTAEDSPGNWGTNTGAPQNGLDAEGNPIHGTPKCRNAVASPRADLVIGKTGVTDAAQNQVITYTISIHNLGNLPAANTLLTDALPAQTTYLTSTPPYPTAIDTRTLVWNFDDVAISLTPTSITLTARVGQEASGTVTNHVTATTTVTDAYPDSNSAQWPVDVRIPSPFLDLTKKGPALTTANTPLTYHLTISNTGDLGAHGVLITDSLPGGLVFLTQTAPYPFIYRQPDQLVWDVGDLAPNTTGNITLTLELGSAMTLTLTNVATATDNTGEDVSAAWQTEIQPPVYLYAVQPGNYGGVSGEAVALLNQSNFTIDIASWCLDDRLDSTTRVCFPPGTIILPGDALWLAENASGFATAWGFDADWAAVAITRAVQPLEGAWPGFTDDGETVYLLDRAGIAVDVLAYGKGEAETGWIGNSVPHPYADYGTPQQVLYRKLDQSTGLPVPDTDRAADWAQDAGDAVNGRKLRYPGWDLEALFAPLELTTTANITIAVAPDAMLETVLETVATAQHSLIIEGYTVGSVPLYEAINDRIQAGVVVTTLLESSPAGGHSDQELWVAQQLHQPPTSTVYFMGGDVARYRYQHAKYILVDNRFAVISTDNFGESSMPSDVKVNGTRGHRGFVAITDNARITSYLRALFHRDCDPAHHIDVFPYTDAFAPPEGFVPIPPVDWTTYTIAFSPTLVTTASHVTLMHAPEHSLRDHDALLGLISKTLTGTIDVMQMHEPAIWTDGAGVSGHNPRLEALVAAAQRGVQVRLLLDAYYDDPLAPHSNTATCLYVNQLALGTLRCRLANTTGKGIHAKIFLVDNGDEKWVHLGSINGSEISNKVNRELALQIESPAAHAYVASVFEYDWAQGHGPMVHRLYLPFVLRDYSPAADYPLITEVFINPGGEDAGKEWIELYNPGNDTILAEGWSIGDAINVGDYGDGRYAFPAGARLYPRQVIVVAACATAFSADYGFNPTYEWTDCDALVPDLTPVAQWEGFGLALGNTSDEVVLHNTSGAIVDSVAWAGEPRVNVLPFPLEAGETFPWNAALKRYPPAYDHDDCERDFYISYQPSPGLVSGSP